MQQFWAFMFHMVVHWHNLCEMENKCTLHNFVVLAINLPKYQNWWKLDKVMTKTILTVFFWDTVYWGHFIIALHHYSLFDCISLISVDSPWLVAPYESSLYRIFSIQRNFDDYNVKYFDGSSVISLNMTTVASQIKITRKFSIFFL